MILHDNDADVVVLNPDWDALAAGLRSALEPAGYRVYFVVPSEDASIRWLRVCFAFGVLDVYGGYYGAEPHADGDGDGAAAADASRAGGAGEASGAGGAGAMIRIPQGHGDLCDLPAALVFPLGRLDALGPPISVPADVVAVLRYRYGEGFMTPRYMDKGRDHVEQGKAYARILGALGRAGLRV